MDSAPPYPEQVTRAVDTLQALGFLDLEDMSITEDGEKAARLSLEPHLARLFLNAKGTGLEDELLALIAVLEIGHLQKSGKDEQEAGKWQYARFVHVTGDHLSLLNFWKTWSTRKRREFRL